MPDIEIWGGIECTINRIRDAYFDQLEFSGHYLRDEDIELFAGLGIKALRYPILWEHHCTRQGNPIEWLQTAQKLDKIKQTGIRVIAGLVHHGSGPSYASLPDATFVEGLEEYAGKVARKFPWITYYTPINEPLTTARFCGLYGFWHPHAKSDLVFSKILLNECKATVLAMKAIRKINPDARLIQTEDIAKTYSTLLLKYQADFENERRWLSYDLLCGKLTKGYRMWDHLIWLGIPEADLNFFVENPCPPDIIGVNHYLTSERFIDENIDKYPLSSHGGNGQHAYADVEAVRVNIKEETGPEILIKEVWDRFKIPIAITEVQLSSTREQQLRWMKHIWDSTKNLKNKGVDILAVTSWSLLGAFGWKYLLTENHEDYETGAFDIRGSLPRPTALAKMIKTLADNKEYNHPFLDDTGWWKKDNRLLYFPFSDSQNAALKLTDPVQVKVNRRPLLIIGKNGTLGKAFAKVCDDRDIDCQLLARTDMDICNPDMVEKVILERNPWAIINAAGYVRVDDAETDAEKCFLDNMAGPLNLSLICKKYGVRLLTFSSDLVFDGKKVVPYLESDVTAPLSIYGHSKAKAEANIISFNPDTLIIRTSSFFGPWDHYNFVTLTLNLLSKNQAIQAAGDSLVSPTYIPDLTNASLDLLTDEESGIWHIANTGEVSWADLAIEVAGRGNFNKDLIEALPMRELKYKAIRPAYSVLKSEKGIILPSLENALDRFFFSNPTINF